MSDTEKQIDAIQDVTSEDELMKLETLLSRSLREEAGQNEHVARMAAQPGELLNGKTAEAVKRLKNQ
jgi:hypothetical protein